MIRHLLCLTDDKPVLDWMHADHLEFRPERPYDEQSPATVVHPNGSLMRVGQRNDDLAAALVRAALEVTQ